MAAFIQSCRELDPRDPAWIPEERSELEEMLAAYTIKGAYLSHRKKETGSIEVGKAADSRPGWGGQPGRPRSLGRHRTDGRCLVD